MMLISDGIYLSELLNKGELLLMCSLVDYVGTFHCTFGLVSRYCEAHFYKHLRDCHLKVDCTYLTQHGG